MRHLLPRIALIMLVNLLAAQTAKRSYGQEPAGQFVLVRDGKPEATIVVAQEPVHAATFAAQELRYHVSKITGALLPLASDHAEVRGPRILVGESAATLALGLRGGDFSQQEYLIRFLPDTLVLMGRDGPEPTTYNVALHGDVKWTRGRFGSALAFNGTDAVVTFEDCEFSDDQGTLEAWVWLPAQTQTRHGTIMRLDGARPWSYHIVQRAPNTSKIQYVTYNGKEGSSVFSAELEEGWHHVMATYSAADGKQELLVNRVSQGTATYRRTTCAGATLKIGGIANPGQDAVSNLFVGSIDEVRVSCTRRGPGREHSPYKPDPDTRVLLHLDEGAGVPRDDSGVLQPVSPPAWYHDQGTSYAVHDFLERFCRVRWYGPSELGMVHPKAATLVVVPKDIRRAPAFLYRSAYPLCPGGIAGALWNNPKPKDMRLFWARLRAGGEAYSCNHSFYGFYGRFLKQHPDWFAQGYAGKPPQMCFSNDDFVKQVVQDARDYFDGKGAQMGARAFGDYFALVPMDNNKWCKCPVCQAQMHEDQRDHPQFSNGFATDYVFGFCNRVARELRKSHPGKYLSTIAYYDYFSYPRRTRLEPNISVQMCMTVRHWWAPGMRKTDMAAYRDWVAKEKDRRLYLWLYYCFPEEYATNRNFHCFPGFFAHTAARQIKMFARDGIRGAFLNGLGEQVDTYVTFKLFDDPNLDVDELLDEFFARYYGAAGSAMKGMYLRIEEIFSSTKYYPEEVQKQDKLFHQTEEMAWGYLGTEERMAELGQFMEQAKQAARSDVEKRRVALFDKAVWQYMVEGRREYAAKQALAPAVAKLKGQPPPTARIPRTAQAGGDPAKVQWDKAAVLDRWHAVEGYPTERKVEARLTHDGEYLYVRLQESLDTRKLVSRPDIWSGDDWELFFAAARAKPYRQIGIAPNGRYAAVDTRKGAWGVNVRVLSDTSAPDRWRVCVALPLRDLVPGGVQPGGKVYANFYRASAGARDLLAWSPNFVRNFHELSRLGECALE